MSSAYRTSGGVAHARASMSSRPYAERSPHQSDKNESLLDRVSTSTCLNACLVRRDDTLFGIFDNCLGSRGHEGMPKAINSRAASYIRKLLARSNCSHELKEAPTQSKSKPFSLNVFLTRNILLSERAAVAEGVHLSLNNFLPHTVVHKLFTSCYCTQKHLNNARTWRPVVPRWPNRHKARICVLPLFHTA